MTRFDLFLVNMNYQHVDALSCAIQDVLIF